MSFLLIIPIFFPIAMGLALLALNFKERGKRQIYVASVCIANMIMSIVFMFTVPAREFTLVRFTDTISITFKVDGLSTVFGMIVSILWVVATFYSFEYMKHEGKENKFFSFFTMSFGVVCGIAFSANLITMYLFYELLTMATLPLVMHAMDQRASSAGKKYVAFSITGASFGFIAIMLLMNFGVSLDFVYGGILTDQAAVAGHEVLLQIGFICAFFGFGVKAAIFPFFNWLPSAGVAPTPVSALLHAVADALSGLLYRSTKVARNTESESCSLVKSLRFLGHRHNVFVFIACIGRNLQADDLCNHLLELIYVKDVIGQSVAP